MNNLIRSLLLVFFLGGTLFCYKDEPRKVIQGDTDRATALEEKINERTFLDIGQNRIFRLKQSANDDRTL